MANGEIKLAKDLKVGDKLQAENGIATVTKIEPLKGKCVEIIPSKGESFVVSENHPLVLDKIVQHRGQHWHRPNTIERCEKTPEELRNYCTYRNGNYRTYCLVRKEIRTYGQKDLPIPPYILGVWLGDGSHHRMEIVSMDQEVIDEWVRWGESLGTKVKKSKQFYKEAGRESKATVYGFYGEKGSRHNPYVQLLKDIGVYRHKHIPKDYLLASWEQRMELLAGILDTDGYLEQGSFSCYELTQKHREVARCVVKLARSLGGYVSVGAKIVNWKGEPHLYYRMHISSKYKIPLRVKHKQGSPESARKDPLHTTFKTRELGEREYLEIELDSDTPILLADTTLVLTKSRK